MDKFEKLDTLDSKILRLLKLEADMPLVDLSERLGISKTSLHRRIQKLKKSKVIQRFTIQINKKQLGLLAIVSIVKNKTSSIEIAARLRKLPQVEKCYSVTGDVSLMIHLRFQNTDELQEILEQIQKIVGVERVLTQLVIEEHFDESVSPLVL